MPQRDLMQTDLDLLESAEHRGPYFGHTLTPADLAGRQRTLVLPIRVGAALIAALLR